MLYKIILVATMSLLICGYPSRVGAEASHHEHHADFYSKWTTPRGVSCCNNQDCRPARDRTHAGIIQVWIDDEWVDVPAEAVRPYASPDLSAHVCAQGKRVICYVPGGGV